MIPWPAKSPDQNCIENIWGILVRCVYQGYRYFDYLESLKEFLILERDNITMDEIRNVIQSMPCCIVECMANRGGRTSY